MSFIDLESKLQQKYIIGVDEVGRGCFMGPMVVGFYIYHNDLKQIDGLNDSKKLTAKKRAALCGDLKQTSKFLLVPIPSSFIDLYGLNLGYLYAFKRFCAYFNFDLSECMFLLDYGIKTPTLKYSQHFKKGDSTCYSIAAASVLAKVYRDNIMCNLEKLYPEFAPSTHKGYGTKKHRDILSQISPSVLHRLSFLNDYK